MNNLFLDHLSLVREKQRFYHVTVTQGTKYTVELTAGLPNKAKFHLKMSYTFGLNSSCQPLKPVFHFSDPSIID